MAYILNALFSVAFFGTVVVPVVSAAVVLLQRDWTTQYGQWFLAGGVISLIGTVAVTVTIHIPMNESIAT